MHPPKSIRQAFRLVSMSCGLLLAQTSLAQPITVCANGCDHESIQAAVNAASAGDTVQLQMLTPHTEFDIIVGKDLTIEGLDTEETVLQGAGTPGVAPARVLTILSGNTVVIRDLTLRHGVAATSDGGGLWVRPDADVTLERLIVSANQSERGGGIYNEGLLELNDVRMTVNLAGLGGGVFNAGELTLEGARVIQNTASGNGVSTGLGGGIYNAGTLSIDSSLTFDNLAQTGGGVYNQSALTINSSTFNLNIALLYRGGGVFSHNASGQPFRITDTIFSSNTAGTDGGGVWVVADSASMERVTLEDNQANTTGIGTGGGGIGNRGLLMLKDTNLIDNLATTGAGILNEGELTISNGLLQGNQATEQGGGISNNYVERPSLTVNNVMVVDNSAQTAGGGIFNTGQMTVGQGTQLIENTANRTGGGIYNAATVPATLSDSLLRSNEVVGDINQNNPRGGGVFTLSPISIHRTRFDSNIVPRNANAPTGRGGGLYALGTQVELVQSAFLGNVGDYGAGIYASNSVVTIQDSALINNLALQTGGGIHSAGNALDLSNVTLGNNFAWFFGGGIYVDAGNVDMANVTINDNRAGNTDSTFFTAGGGLYHCPNCGATLRMRSSVIANNRVGDAGEYPDCFATFTSSSFSLIGDTGPAFMLDEQCEVSGFTAGMIYNADARLDLLAGYNSEIQSYDFRAVYPLLPDSPAVDSGLCVDAVGDPLANDQRGAPMPVDGDASGSAECDMGAYEYLSEPPVLVESLFNDDFESP